MHTLKLLLTSMCIGKSDFRRALFLDLLLVLFDHAISVCSIYSYRITTRMQLFYDFFFLFSSSLYTFTCWLSINMFLHRTFFWFIAFLLLFRNARHIEMTYTAIYDQRWLWRYSLSLERKRTKNHLDFMIYKCFLLNLLLIVS